MSPSETTVRAALPMWIEVDPGRTLGKEDIRVQVFNHLGQPVHQGRGDQQVELPPGLYTVRIEFGSEWQDEIVRHASAGTQVYLALPERPSPVPVFGTSTVHEYYSYTSQELSRKNMSGNSGIFLFVRMHAKEMVQGEWLWENLYLLDRDRNRLLAFGPANGEENKEYGYYGATVPLAPGLYILQQQGPVPREMPLHVFDGWQTQMFVFFRERPLLESATVLMNHYGAGFNPDDRLTDVVDMALRGLQSDDETLPTEALNMLLYGKFDNPMLGLLGAHFMLRRQDVDKGMLGIVLHNLNSLLPGSPDVAALALMAREEIGISADFGLPHDPPMLRPALEAIFDYSARDEKYSDLVPPGTLLEKIAPTRYTDSAYATWNPPKTTRTGVAPWILDYLTKQKESAQISGKPVDLPHYARKLNQPLRTIQAAWAIVSAD